MSISDVTQQRLADRIADHARLLADIERLKRELEQAKAQACRVLFEISTTRLTLEENQVAAAVDSQAPKPREKVLVQPAALKLLAEEPMTAEALAARIWFGAHKRQVLSWVTRALRHGKIKKRDDDCLEVSP